MLVVSGCCVLVSVGLQLCSRNATRHKHSTPDAKERRRLLGHSVVDPGRRSATRNTQNYAAGFEGRRETTRKETPVHKCTVLEPPANILPPTLAASQLCTEDSRGWLDFFSPSFVDGVVFTPSASGSARSIVSGDQGAVQSAADFSTRGRQQGPAFFASSLPVLLPIKRV